MTMKKLLIIGTLIISNSLIAQQTPAPNQDGAVLIIGATAHIGNGEVIENSTIGFRNGKIYERFVRKYAKRRSIWRGTR